MKILRIATVAVAMFAAGSGSGYAAQSSNRIGLNGLTANRIGLNGLTTNRISPNRISPNRISPNRIGLNGISLNGAQPDDAFALRDALRVLARKPLAR